MNNQHDLLGGERRMEGGDELTLDPWVPATLVRNLVQLGNFWFSSWQGGGVSRS